MVFGAVISKPKADLYYVVNVPATAKRWVEASGAKYNFPSYCKDYINAGFDSLEETKMFAALWNAFGLQSPVETTDEA